MAAITANLLAAAAPPLNPAVNFAAQTVASTQPNSRSGFADVLTQAIARPPTTRATPTAAAPTATEPPTDSGENPDLVATALAAFGLIQQPLPDQLPLLPPTSIPASAVAATISATAQAIPTTTDTTAGTTPPTNTAAPTASRTEQLRFETAPAARGTQPTPAVPTPLPMLPTATTVEPNRPLPAPQTSPALPVVPAIPNTTVATVPTDVIPAAARTPAVVAQVPLVAERSQQLPALPPELGYSLVGPTVEGPQAVNPVPAVGGTPSQGQVEVRAAGLPSTPTPDVRPLQQTRPFAEVFTEPATPITPESVPSTSVGVPTAPVVTRLGNPQPVEASAASPPETAPLQATGSPPTAPQTATTQPARPQPADTPPTTAQAPTAAVSRPVKAEGAAPTIQSTDKAPTPARVNTVSGEASITTTQPAAGGTKTPEANDGFLSEVVVPVPVDPAVAGGPTPTATSVTAPQSRPAEPTPADSPRVNPTPSPVAAQVSEAFVSQARVIERGGRHEFQLRLDPPELGEVKVRVLAMGDKIEARLVVSDDAVRKMIESQLPDLRQRLEQAGVSVPKFDVTTDGGRASTGGDAWDRRQPPAPPRTATPTTAPTARPAATGGLLDVTA